MAQVMSDANVTASDTRKVYIVRAPLRHALFLTVFHLPTAPNSRENRLILAHGCAAAPEG